jgi:hypothetical protein
MSESSSMFSAYVALLKVLHKKKIVDINDVVSEMGNTIDFAKIQHMDKTVDQAYSVVVYESLQQIASAMFESEEKIRKSQSGDQGFS